jgi:hypothetical protein
MPTSHDRAERFAGLLPGWPEDERTHAVHLLTDCLHWCHEHGHDFDQLLRVARGYFTEERGEGLAGKPAERELAAALDYLLEQTVDMDLKHGIALTEGEAEAREQALAALARARSGGAGRESGHPLSAGEAPRLNRYVVRVEVCCAEGAVYVEAPTQEEAEHLAQDEFVPEYTTTVLEENGALVEWSSEAHAHDPSNPYAPVQRSREEEAEPGPEPER